MTDKKEFAAAAKDASSYYPGSSIQNETEFVRGAMWAREHLQDAAPRTLQDIIKQGVLDSVERTGNRVASSKELGVSLRTLREWLNGHRSWPYKHCLKDKK